MTITPVTTPHTDAITTVTPPSTAPVDAKTATMEHAAGIDRAPESRGTQTNRATRWRNTVPPARQTLLALAAALAAALALSAPVHADVDTDFANQLHVYGVYGPRDYNAWLGKITCNRLSNGTDTDAYKSAAFLSKNLPQGTTTAQTWQFLNSAINTYCPDQMPVLTSAAGRRQ